MSPVKVEIENGPSFEIATAEDALLRGALRAGLGFPYECNVGGCGSCRFELLDGEMVTLWDAAPGLSERERKRGKRLACQSRPLGDCRIRVRLDGPGTPAAERPRQLGATLLARRAVTDDMSEFTLQLPSSAAADFRAGQYALLTLDGVPGVRAYSMSNLPGADGIWQFLIRHVPGGQGSTAMFERVAVGDTLRVDGPYGHAYLRPGRRPVVCIAGGSGLGPMLSVARGVLAGDADDVARPVHFFLGLRSQADLGAEQEVRALADARLHLTTVLSSPDPQAPWHGPTGWIHAEVERALPTPLDQFDFYFAGPPPMIEAVQDLLMVRHRVPFEQIHFDRFL